MKDVVERNLCFLVKCENGSSQLGIMSHPQGFLANEFQNFLLNKKDVPEEKRR